MAGFFYALIFGGVGGTRSNVLLTHTGLDKRATQAVTSVTPQEIGLQTNFRDRENANGRNQRQHDGILDGRSCSLLLEESGNRREERLHGRCLVEYLIGI